MEEPGSPEGEDHHEQPACTKAPTGGEHMPKPSILPKEGRQGLGHPDSALIIRHKTVSQGPREMAQ